MKNEPCPCRSGKKYRNCCWLRRFETPAKPLTAVAPPTSTSAIEPQGLFDDCPCGSSKTYRRCCFPRTFPDFLKHNGGIEPQLERAATMRALRRLASNPPDVGVSIDTVDVGLTRLDCAPMQSVGDGVLEGTLAPPSARQIEAKFDYIRETNSEGVTEVVVDYTYPEMFGHAEARMVFDADDLFRLADGQVVSVLNLSCGMKMQLTDGSIGTVTIDPELRQEYPHPPFSTDNGLWSSRVVGSVKHIAYEMIEFAWAGQNVRVTPGHAVWSADREWWIRAYELRPGELIRVAGNEFAPVEGPGRVQTGPVEVYGIEVEYFHNYFVGHGPDAMLVHNGPECVLKPVLAEAELPIGVSQRQFDKLARGARRLSKEAGLPEGDLVVQGSRVAGKPRENPRIVHNKETGRPEYLEVSDIDVALRVGPKEFFDLAETALARARPGTRLRETMLRRIQENGQLSSFDLGSEFQRLRLHHLDPTIEHLPIQFSVIKVGGKFDQGPFISLKGGR